MKKRKNQVAKLIFVSSDSRKITKAQKFADKNEYQFDNYTEDEWATVEEINDYIQDEVTCSKIIQLPEGKTPVYEETKTPEQEDKIERLAGSDKKKKARIIKIAEAATFKKFEKEGEALKKQREEELKKLKKAS